MAEDVLCPRCSAPKAPDGSCPACDAGAEGGSDTHLFEWGDGQGRPWRIEVQAAGLHLSSASEQADLPRVDWNRTIQFSPLDAGAVVRFDTGLREVGFLLTRAQAAEFVSALALAGGPQLGTREAATPAAVVPRRAVRNRVSPDWPRMSGWAVAALFLSILSFLPIVGVLCTLGAWVLAVVAWRKSGPQRVWQHVRFMSRFAAVAATVGLGICALGTYTLLMDTRPGVGIGYWDAAEVKWSWGARIAGLVVMIVALSVHEAAHAITAWWCGDDYACSLGRVTLNPLAHIDPFGTLLLPLLLTFASAPVFGYARPVPVNLGAIRHYRRAHIFISAAGPLANLLQAGVCLALLLLVGAVLSLIPDARVGHLSDWEPIVEISGVPGGRVLGAVALMLKLGFYINVILAFFNLIPVPPLDGSWILEHLFPKTLGRLYAVIRPTGFLFFLGLLWFGRGAISYMMLPGYLVVFYGQELIWQVTGF